MTDGLCQAVSFIVTIIVTIKGLTLDVMTRSLHFINIFGQAVCNKQKLIHWNK